jgi:Zn-dependent protease
MLPIWYAAFLLSLTCHEAAHAFAAQRGGDATAYLAGQVSLNPLPHLRREPFGMVLFPLLSFVWFTPGWMMGWASAPYDPFWEDRHPRRAALMSAAGPAANLLLAGFALLALAVGLSTGMFQVPEVLGFDRLVGAGAGMPAFVDGLGRLLSVLLSLNLLLCVFNLAPFPPLDGAAVLAGLVPPFRAPYRAMRGSPVAALAGFVLASLLIRKVYGPLLSWVVGDLLYG